MLMKSKEGGVQLGRPLTALTQFENCLFENMKLEALKLWGKRQTRFQLLLSDDGHFLSFFLSKSSQTSQLTSLSISDTVTWKFLFNLMCLFHTCCFANPVTVNHKCTTEMLLWFARFLICRDDGLNVISHAKSWRYSDLK